MRAGSLGPRNGLGFPREGIEPNPRPTECASFNRWHSQRNNFSASSHFPNFQLPRLRQFGLLINAGSHEIGTIGAESNRLSMIGQASALGRRLCSFCL